MEITILKEGCYTMKTLEMIYVGIERNVCEMKKNNNKYILVL